MEELEAYRALRSDHAKASTGTSTSTSTSTSMSTSTATGRGTGTGVDTAADAQSCNERGASEGSGRAPGSGGGSDASDASDVTSDVTSDETSDVLLSFWATPLVVVNVTKRRAEMGATSVDHTRLRHLASEAFDEANSYEPLVSDEHGQLTPNNQLFEWQSKSRFRRGGAQLLSEVVRARGCRLSLQSHPTPPHPTTHTHSPPPRPVHLLNQAPHGAVTGLESLYGEPSWRAIVEEVRSALERHSSIGRVSSNASFYGWISVHHDDSKHEQHAHFDAALSAVYYISVPPDAPPIIFHDPRGLSPYPALHMPQSVPAPPFSERFVHYPSEGELVIFPSWLVHSVEHPNGGGGGGGSSAGGTSGGTAGAAARVSASFNVAGSWEGTAPIQAHI